MPPGPGRDGGPRGLQHHPSNLNLAGGRQQVSSAPATPQDAGFGGGGHQGNQLAHQMSAMDLNGGPPGSRGSADGNQRPGDYAHSMNNGREPPPRGNPPQAYQDPRRGPSGQASGGYGGYSDGYGSQAQQHPGHEFGGPQRSMTMPLNSGPAGQGMPPLRPATTTGNRPPPHRTYPSQSQVSVAPSHHSINYSVDYGHQGQIDDVYDSYYNDDDDGGNDGGGYDSHLHDPSRLSVLPDFDAIPIQNKRGSFETSMQPGAGQSQQGAHQTAKLSHAKSMIEMREPQSAVFEMAGDVPDVPALPPMTAYQPGANHSYNGSGGFEPVLQRRPSAPPGSMIQPGYPNNPPIVRPGTTVSQSSNPDSLPAHPTPVRPGLMQNSLVNPSVKPPPVRNYGGIPQTAPPVQQYQPPPQQQQQQQQQQQYPQQPSPPQSIQGGPAPREQPEEEKTPVTPQELEHLRMIIKNNPNDQIVALKLAKRLIEGSETLIPNVPDPRARARARDRYLVDAQKILKKLSQSQNQEAMFVMADGIGKGLFGGEPDNKEAFTLYQSAAKLGHAAAAYRTAVCCEIGHEEGGGTRKDPLKAIQWYKRAATLGDPPAMYKVGMILLKGLLGQPKNPREAVGWLKRAAERADAENPHALHELGLLYESAQGNDVIIRDEEYALTLFQQAAELGYKFSQFKLGCAYEYGLMGCPIDPRLSIVWYSRAATQEEHQSELALSGWYLTGSEGVLGQSDTEAYLWARKAAIAGLAKAEYAMGYFTEVGIGVPANLEDAKRWYWRAAAQDFPKARERLEDLKRSGKGSRPRPRERISRSQQQEGDCVLM
ncbi:Chitin synthase regulator 2 [Cladobotryum mycophilum]|uniref:Chitin synthase regulator 2 n=1 Tax=Cladobotryum mycophilum TaxID=491253 RepID=A0ABR0T344_9HYPO